MKAKINFLCICLSILPLVAVAKESVHKQKIIVQDNDTVVAIISKREITRIAFESDITFISSITGELEYTTKEQDLYLRPNVEKPINFFVKTADEHTYKLLVSASDIPAIQIFIKSNNQQNVVKSKLVLHGKHTISEALQKKIAKLIEIALKPQKHLGFKFKKTNETLEAINDLSLKKVAEVEGSQLNAEIIIITNESESPKRLNPSEFLDEGVMAIYREKPELNSGEKTKLIRIKG